MRSLLERSEPRQIFLLGDSNTRFLFTTLCRLLNASESFNRTVTMWFEPANCTAGHLNIHYQLWTIRRRFPAEFITGAGSGARSVSRYLYVNLGSHDPELSVIEAGALLPVISASMDSVVKNTQIRRTAIGLTLPCVAKPHSEQCSDRCDKSVDTAVQLASRGGRH